MPRGRAGSRPMQKKDRVQSATSGAPAPRPPFHAGPVVFHDDAGAAERGSGAARLSTEARRDFARVYEEQFDFVWRSLRLLGVRPDALDDVSQDVFSAVA